MKKPEKKELHKGKPFNFSQREITDNIYGKGYNHACDKWEAYIRDIGGITECRLLHEQDCQCENDE